VNAHEERAWRILVELGATETEIGGRKALDVRTCRASSGVKMELLLDAYLNVVGRSGTLHRHVSRRGCAIYVVKDA
jgi:hypothetical protein